MILPPGEEDKSSDARTRFRLTIAGWILFAAVCVYFLYIAFTISAPVHRPAPRIEAFVASGARGTGDTWNVLLTWSTINADDIQIAPDVGKVEPEGRRTLQIQKDTTFTMTAKGPGGTATHELEVKVTGP